MKKTISIFSLFLFLAICSNAQVLNYEVKQSVAVNYKKLAQIDTIVNSYITKHWENGVTVLIVKDNQVIYHKGLG